MKPCRWRRIVLVIGLTLLGCGPDTHTPAGTTADPVEVCADIAQVCRYDGAKLGVCVRRADGALGCASQH